MIGIYAIVKSILWKPKKRCERIINSRKPLCALKPESLMTLHAKQAVRQVYLVIPSINVATANSTQQADSIGNLLHNGARLTTVKR